MEEIEIKEENKVVRNPDGTIVSGTNNPKGITGPRKRTTVTKLLQDKLEEVPVGQMKTYGALLAEALLNKAYVEMDPTAIKLVLNYVEGMPRQNIGIDGGEDGKPVEISVETKGVVNAAIVAFLKGNNINDESSTNTTDGE
jgi:hypothetical protein